MGGYKPLKITGNSAGLIQEREEFLLPNDAYPTLQNAYCWRERILKKKGSQLLGRLQRNFMSLNYFPTGGTSTLTYTTILNATGYIIAANNLSPGQITTGSPHNLSNGDQVIISNIVGATGYNGTVFTVTVVDQYNFTIGVNAGGFGLYVSGGIFESNHALTSIEPYAMIVPNTLSITVNSMFPKTFTDNGSGGMVVLPSSTVVGSVNYYTGFVQVATVGTNTSVTISYSYYPSLPCMGIRTEELTNSLNDQTIFFDQRYAYIYNTSTNQFNEFINGTEWNKHHADTTGVDFFWSTNYWVSQSPQFSTSNRKLFWVTNNTGAFGANQDPIRITDGATWYNFQPPNDGQIDATNFVVNCLAMLPFRGRLVMFNTWEGPNTTSALNKRQRIRWSTIGNPFIAFANPPDVPVSVGSWRDDIRGQGGFLDIPTSEDIISVGFVRDNLVIYCERSTWQLRYTGRAIAPFQIERVNSELGADSLFSTIQFDTSLIGIGDKGIVECDSYKSNRIDVKIPDFVFDINSGNNGPERIQGVRDFINRLAFWNVGIDGYYDASVTPVFPNQRLVYNYENDSWSLFDDSITALGNFQPGSSRTWINTNLPWTACNFPWIQTTNAEIPLIAGGNQQGFISLLDQTNFNDPTLVVTALTQGVSKILIITIPNHNLVTGQIIYMPNLLSEAPDVIGNGTYFKVKVVDSNNINIMCYNTLLNKFQFFAELNISPQEPDFGEIRVTIVDNWSVISKQFNFLDDGQNIQLGHIDILTLNNGVPNTSFSINVYENYDAANAINTLPRNALANTSPFPQPDTFFNSMVPMYSTTNNTGIGSKVWSRIYCPARASFIQIQYTLTDTQMVTGSALVPIQIDAQVLWIRKGGRMTEI